MNVKPTRRSLFTKLTLAAALTALASLGASPAIALPKERDAAANVRLEDADGKALDLASLKGKPYLIVYDDKASSPKSEAFKIDLVKQLRASGALAKMKLVFTGDVSGLNFWPVKGIVLDDPGQIDAVDEGALLGGS